MGKEDFGEALMRAMKGAREASELYANLAKLAPRGSVGRIILALRDEERRHATELTAIYNAYCSGYEPDVEPD